MEQINIIFFALLSFFNIENGLIGAEKTTVTINPSDKSIEIIQEKLFTIIQNPKDTSLVHNQWNEMLKKQKLNSWTTELSSFKNKKLEIENDQNQTRAIIHLTYNSTDELRAFGIWYNSENNTFSTNHVPNQNLETVDGVLEKNYWNFKDDSAFSFTLEPFKNIPAEYLKLKQPLEEIIKIKLSYRSN